MTQAFNLSQLANKVNTSGQLDVSTGASGTLAPSNGGTGLSSVGTAGNILTSDGTNWISSAPSGGVTSVNGQTGAVVTTNLGSIGATMNVLYVANSTGTLNTDLFVAANTTVAGSSLRYDTISGYFTQSYYYTPGYKNSSNNNTTYLGGGTSLSGTWRVLSRSNYSTNFNLGSPGYVCVWWSLIAVRIS